MVEKGIRGGKCHAIYRYAKANNKYMKDYNKDEEESFLEYLDANNLYGGPISEPLPGYILEVDVDYPKNLHDLHSDLPFLPERMKLDKYNKLLCNLYDKKDYVVHTRSLKQALNHGLILKKVHRVMQFNQEARLKAHIDMNTELRKQARNDFERSFYKLTNNSVFGKTM